MPFTVEEVSDFAEFKRRVRDLEMEARWKRGGKAVFVFEEGRDPEADKMIAHANSSAGEGELIRVRIPSAEWRDEKSLWKRYAKIRLNELPYACLYYRKVVKDSAGASNFDHGVAEVLRACIDYKEPNKVRDRAEAKQREKEEREKAEKEGGHSHGHSSKPHSHSGTPHKARSVEKKNSKTNEPSEEEESSADLDTTETIAEKSQSN